MYGFMNSLEYDLDQWQKDAIGSMTKGHSVFAAVPTGSGKTVLAEYAATLGKKVIYTAPLKAISNQKYHDFSKKFPTLIWESCARLIIFRFMILKGNIQIL
jgi:superfamily II RNA helicase